jgi:hypothetical protein
MLESQGAHSAGGGGKYDITLQLKSEVSQLSGQNSELRSRLVHCEGELKSALRLAERRECEVNHHLINGLRSINYFRVKIFKIAG